MYYAALTCSNKLVQIDGEYETFRTSMEASGMLQFDLWNVVPSSGLWDWDSLKSDIQQHGLRNSLLLAQMSTAGTSIFMDHTESIEAPQSNVFTRTALSGRFQVVNRYMVKDLKKLGLWTPRIRNKIMENDGSIQFIEVIRLNIRQIYKTINEYKLTSLIRIGADREAYICQSSSNNRCLPSPDMSLLTYMHLYSWKQGQKTSSYNVRIKQLNTGKKFLIKESVDESECQSCTA